MWYLKWENPKGKIIRTKLHFLDGSHTKREFKEKAKELAEETWKKIPPEKRSIGCIPLLEWKETFPINWGESEKNNP
ncbi:MAG: hypothetical protein PHT16_02095 [Candidatus Pacebacteria bacterium]|nr:hypothetical protein [Candidatus Paceibacterota bacterium]